MRGWFLCLAISLVFVCGLRGENLANSPGSEIGDAVFRPLGLWDVLDLVEHTAVYRSSDGRKDWKPMEEDLLNSSWEHSVIQASGEGTVVHWQDFETFKSGLWQKGRGYTSSRGPLSPLQRRLILQAARSQYGAWYPRFPDHWRWPYVMFPREQAQGDTLYPNGSFRCDGLVEWCYDQIGMGSFSEEEQQDCYILVVPIPVPPYWQIVDLPTFYPAALRRRMTPESPTPPDVEISYDSDNKQLIVKADDGDYGSGIDDIRVWLIGYRVWLKN